MKPSFKAGNNIAIKVPEHEFEQTVAFYQDVLGFERLGNEQAENSSAVFEFGTIKLWIDKCTGLSQAEVWLEINTDDPSAAASYLKQKGCAIRPEIEPLDPSINAFWLSSPANIIHLVDALRK